MDAPGTRATVHGVVHWTLGSISFASVIVIGFVGAQAFADRSWGRTFAMASRLSGTLAAVGLLVISLSTRLHARR